MDVSNNNVTSSCVCAGDFIKNRLCLYAKPNDIVCEVIKKMQENHTYAAAVIEGDKLIGLLTGQDILIRAAAWRINPAPSMESVAKAFNAMKAADVMIPDPLTVQKETPLDQAMRIMTENGFRYLPVASSGYPVGILNIIDVIKFMEEKSRRESETKDQVLSYIMSHENYGCVSKN